MFARMVRWAQLKGEQLRTASTNTLVVLAVVLVVVVVERARPRCCITVIEVVKKTKPLPGLKRCCIALIEVVKKTTRP